MNLHEIAETFFCQVLLKHRKKLHLRKKPLKLFLLSYPLVVFFILDIVLLYALIVSLGKLKYESNDYQMENVNELFLNYQHLRTQDVFVYSDSLVCNRIVLEMYHENIKYSQLDPALIMTVLMQLCLLIDLPQTNSHGAVSHFQYNPSRCSLSTLIHDIDLQKEASGSLSPNYERHLVYFLKTSTASQFNSTDFHTTLDIFEEKMSNLFNSVYDDNVWQMSYQLYDALKKVEMNEELAENLFKKYISPETKGFYQVKQYFKEDFSSLKELLNTLREMELEDSATKEKTFESNLCQNIVNQFPSFFGNTSLSEDKIPQNFLVRCTGVCCASVDSVVEKWFIRTLRRLFLGIELERSVDINSDKSVPSSSRVIIKKGETLIAGASTHGSIFGNLLSFGEGFRNNLGEFDDISSFYPHLDVPHVFQTPNGDKYVFLGSGGSFRRSKDIFRLSHIFMQHFLFGNTIFNTFQCIEQNNLIERTIRQVVDRESIKADRYDNLPDNGVLIRFSKNRETEIFYFNTKSTAKPVVPFFTA